MILTALPALAIASAVVAAVTSRRMAPQVAVRSMRTAAVAATVAGVLAPLAVALSWLLDHAVVWHVDLSGTEAAPQRLDTVFAIGSLGLLGLGLCRVALWARRQLAVGSGIPHAVAGGIAVVDDAEPAAFASPRHGGVIVVTTGLWTVLDDAERGAVLAHERAHLALGHAGALGLAEVAAAVNPLLVPLRTAMRAAVERAADEAAATTIGDRATVARAIGAAALRRRRAPLDGVLAAAGGSVEARVRALVLVEPGRSSSARLVPRLAFGLAGLCATAEVAAFGGLLAHITLGR